MKKILLLTLTILCMNSSSFYAQNTDLSNLDKKQRKEYLIKLAKEVVLNFGPEYYQEDYISDVSADSKESVNEAICLRLCFVVNCQQKQG